MVEALDLLWQTARDSQPLELSTETSAQLVLGVMLKCLRSCGLCMFDFFATVGDVLFESIERGFDKISLACPVFFFGQIGKEQRITELQ